MPSRKKSKRGSNLAKLNQVHPKDLPDDPGAASAAPRDLVVIARPDSLMCVSCAESEYEHDAAAEDEDESEEEEARGKGVAGEKKRKQRKRAARTTAETTSLTKIDSFFRPTAAATHSSSAPAAAGASSAEGSPLSLGSPAGLSPAGSSATPAASTASPEHPGTSPADASADAPSGAEPPSMDCPICLHPVDASATHGDACTTLSCGHQFHADCIVKWLRTERAGASCPVCRDGPSRGSTSADSPPKPAKPTGPAVATPSAAVAGSSTIDTPRSGYSANSVKLRRPPGSSGGSLTRVQSAPSHRGLGPRSLGSSTMESKAVRASSRLQRAASRPRSEQEPPAPALPAEPKNQRADAGVPRGPQLLARVPDEMIKTLRRINHKKQLERTDVVGGDALSPVEWLQLRNDDYEMRTAV